ncbi:MAG TPA: HsdM family class I SAM-dependent methyltransferase, partial [Candidatus Wunengus sp. YC63]|uniref:HsdM family class I SAM-dependent methyltransferase n=2 Tax=unclassified Candidatus Wunengus TaxID=3367695 RepID=UPI004024E35C
MANIKSNEREFTSQVISWLNEAISQGTYPFEIATSEASLKISSSETNFPDVQIWLNRASGIGFCGWELKTPDTPADDKTLLEDATRKARAMRADYFVTWNMRDAIIWRTPNLNEAVSHEHRLKTYPIISPVTEPNDLWVVSKQELLKGRAQEILYDLSILQREGHLHLIDVDSTFFVHILTESAKTLVTHIHQSLVTKMGKDKRFKEGLFDWAVRQAIANYDDLAFYRAVSRQVIYRLLGKILFYLTLRRFRSDLPAMHLTDINQSQINERLKEYFEMARKIDYQAVFEEDFTDSIPIPPSGVEPLITLIEDLNRFNFSCMPHDVVGNVFEKLIPPEDRHNMGQYFTREELVDLINAFCIQTVDAKVIDPTCGSGTFLIRGYDRLKNMGEKSHTTLLSNLWGVDVAHFPAELATINLYRQNLSDYRNFPRIVSKDFFDVKPGDAFKFPPPKDTGEADFMIPEKLPAFDAAVGNFPYIRQELIEKRVKGYKEKLGTTLWEEWKPEYLDLFEGQNIKLSGQADIYAYLFFHTARFLKEDGGRMGIVTSNSWLDVAYGYELQRFFLKKFKIVAILESRCEPWFEEAAINTVVTILERIPSKTAVSEECRDNHLVKFVKIKKRLKELIPWDMKLEGMRRWGGLDKIVHKIEKTGSEHFELKGTKIENTLQGIATYEDDAFRIRVISQGELFKNLESAGKTVKWGQYLRAPDVYFEILEKCKDKLVPLKEVAEVRFGIKTGINEFFHLASEKVDHWRIEEDFLFPLVTSPKEIEMIRIDPKSVEFKAFVCSKAKKELREARYLGALKYIEWGEKQRTKERGGHKKGGTVFPEVPSVQGRPIWYDLGEPAPGDFVINRFIGERLFFPINKAKVLIGDIAFVGDLKNRKDFEIFSVILNSTIISMSVELNGRVGLGEGLLTFYGPDIVDLPVINPNIISAEKKKGIIKAFEHLLTRPILPIFEEVKMKDRQRLDSLVLEAIGLDPKKYLKPIYDGICELVRERIVLAGMRKKIKTTKTEKDIE